MKLVSKITFKSVVGAPEMQTIEVTDENGNKKPALRGIEKLYMRIFGIVNDVRTVQSQYGDSIGFRGEIRAINLTTGEEFNSGEVFLPAIGETYVYNAFCSASGVDGFGGLELAFDIGVKPSATPMGYEYTIAPLIENTAPDRLASLAGRLPAPALPKPTTKGE